MTTATSSRRSGKRTRAAPDPVTAYAQAVTAGRIVAGRAVRLACRRHLQDLETGLARGLRWRPDLALRAIEFFPAVLRLHEGQFAGHAFRLEGWQAFIVGSLFGWLGEDGFRRFRVGYIETGKGNGKSPLLGGVGLYGLTEDDEPSAGIYSAATQRGQARLLWLDAKRMAQSAPGLARRLEILEHSLFDSVSGSVFLPVSAEARGFEGIRVHMGLIDEIWAHADAEVIQAIRRGTKGRRQALILEITNSGFDRLSICWQHHEMSLRVLEGVIHNDAWFAYVCQLDVCAEHRDEGHDQPVDGCAACDQWTDEAVWPKPNPNLGVSVSVKYLRERVAEATNMPATQNDVKRANFCIWTQSLTRWLSVERWQACATPVPESELAGRPCYAGLDLGQSDDFAAFVRLWTLADGRVVVRPRFWIPEATLLRVRTRPYDVWQRAGALTVTPGDVVDYPLIEATLLADCRAAGVRQLRYDKRFAEHMAQTLQGQGLALVEQPQGFALNEALRSMADLVKTGRLCHDGNPVLGWMASNAVIRHGTRGDIRLDKERAPEKIDGIAALVFAEDARIHTPPPASPRISVL